MARRQRRPYNGAVATTPIRHSVTIACPICGMRRTQRAISAALAESYSGPIAPDAVIWGAFNRAGQRGLRWERLPVGPLPEQFVASWRRLRAVITTRMLSWLDRYAIDFDGSPIVVSRHRHDELPDVAPAVAAPASMSSWRVPAAITAGAAVAVAAKYGG